MKIRVLITGGTGFAGTHLTRLLLGDGQLEVHLTSYGGGQSPSLLPAEQTHQLDLTNLEATRRLVAKLHPDQVYHLAAIAASHDSFQQASRVLTNNIQLQLNLLQALSSLNSKARILVIGSADGYGWSRSDELPISETHPFRPVNPYAVSKVAQELLALAYAHTHNLQIVVARPFNHIGPGQTAEFAVAAFARQIALIEAGRQSVLLTGTLSSKRDLTHVSDVVEAYRLLMTQGKPGEVYNIGSGHSVSMRSVLRQLIRLARVPVVVKQDPRRLRPADVPEMRADISKIARLGWRPRIDLTQSLTQVLDYWRTKV